MLSDSKWDFDGLVSETSRQVNTLIGGMKAALLIDETAFAKKGAVEVPKSARVAQSKVELAREMIFGARRHGVRFGHVAFDAVYGSAGWLLRELDDEGITFMREVRCDQPCNRHG